MKLSGRRPCGDMISLFSRKERQTGRDHVSLGKSGEDAAVKFLQKLEFTILEKNYRTPVGEVDIIARENDIIVFVEVKTRKSLRCGNPFEAVDLRKQRQVSKVALDYITRKGLIDSPARFDVISVTVHDERQADVEIIRNAFDFVGDSY